MTRVILTYTDYAALPDDGRRYELHEGELSVMPSPGTRHQRVNINLCYLLLQYVRAHQLGELFHAPTDCILSDTTVVQPDILFIDAQHASLVSERAIEGSPTLAVEVLSPSTVQIDRRRKAQLYASHGVPWYWIVDPVAREIEAYALDGGATAWRRVWPGSSRWPFRHSMIWSSIPPGFGPELVRSVRQPLSEEGSTVAPLASPHTHVLRSPGFPGDSGRRSRQHG